MRNWILTVISAVLLTACGDEGVFYDQSPSKVEAALKTGTLPTSIMGSSAVRTKVSKPLPDTMQISVTDQQGSLQSRIVVQITPDGSGSRVMAQWQDTDGNTLPNDMAQKFANEHVAASIEGRPFDMTFATPAIAKAMLASNPEVSNRIKAANQTATAFAKLEQDMADNKAKDDFRKKYGDDWGASSAD